MTGPLLVRCPAKINTRLLVLGRRPDGYHELDTTFLGLTFSDTLEIETSDDWSLEVTGATEDEVPTRDNLVLRAGRLVQGEVGRRRLPGAHLRLIKRIPAAAGLGGGSSDAAGALVGLVRLHGLTLPPGRLDELALEIGSDVPYFLRGGHQRGRGRGEVLERLPDPPDRPVILVHPDWGLSTKTVFDAFARQAAALTSRKTGTSFEAGVRDRVGTRELENDLLTAAIGLRPELGGLLEAILEVAPGRGGLTGSGPTLFVLLEPDADAADVRERLARELPSRVGLRVTRTMGAAEHQATRFTALAG